MIILCVFTAFTSMFVDNVTIILLMVPVTLSIFRALKISPIPFILGQTLSCNIGGAATLIGDPQTSLLAQQQILTLLHSSLIWLLQFL